MPSIIRVEDLPNIGNGNLWTGALFYASQSGSPFNVNGYQIDTMVNANSGNFATIANLFITGQTLYNDIIGLSGLLQNTGQNLYGYITGLSGALNSSGTVIENFITNIYNSLTLISGEVGVTGINGLTGGITLVGKGNITITQPNQSTINISGTASIVTGANINSPSIVFTTNIDWSQSNTFRGTLTGTSTITFSNNSDGQTVVVLTSGTPTGNSIVTWPNNVKWPNSSVPPATSGVDVYTFVQLGTSVYATVVQNFPF